MTIGVKKCFGLPEDFKSPIWHLKLGKCQIVIARIYVLIGLVCFSSFAVYYAITKPYTIQHSFFERPNTESVNITASWTDYLE